MRKITKTIMLLACLMAFGVGAKAQVNPVRVTNLTQQINGKDYYFYVLEQGQTVFSVSRAYGLHYSAAVLKTDIHNISVGDTIWLPVNAQSRAAVSQACGSAMASATATYQEILVQQGQTLYSLSKAYNTTVEEIENLNPSVKDEGLKAGQTIKVPLGSHAGNTVAKTNTQQPKGNANGGQAKSAASTAAPKPASNVKLEVRERISKEKVYVSVMMPLYLDRINEISTTKFDIEQRGKKTYKSFEFIQFYEGLLLAVDQLQNQGYKVVLNVVDVSAEDDASVTEAFNSHNCANSDLIIALLTRAPFSKAAQLAKENKVFIVSPMSTRDEILNDNPYVVKYMPSDNAVAAAMIEVMNREHAGGNLYVLQSKARAEAPLLNAFKSQLEGNSSLKFHYSIVDWAAIAKLGPALKSTHDNVVVNLFDQGKDKNRIQLNNLLNKLIGLNEVPVLMSAANYVRDVNDIDFSQLQRVNYHMIYTAYLDYNNTAHKAFVDNFKDRYRTEPVGVYAGVANDILIYFVTAINQKGTTFWYNPSQFAAPSTLLFPLQIERSQLGGFENQKASLYKMKDFHLVPATR